MKYAVDIYASEDWGDAAVWETGWDYSALDDAHSAAMVACERAADGRDILYGIAHLWGWTEEETGSCHIGGYIISDERHSYCDPPGTPADQRSGDPVEEWQLAPPHWEELVPMHHAVH